MVNRITAGQAHSPNEETRWDSPNALIRYEFFNNLLQKFGALFLFPKGQEPADNKLLSGSQTAANYDPSEPPRIFPEIYGVFADGEYHPECFSECVYDVAI